MNRREAIKKTSMMLGYAVSASAVAAVMNGCKADSNAVAKGLDNWTPEFFTREEGRMAASIAECILPETDTPGAISAGVHSFIDLYMKANASPDEQKGMKEGLAVFDRECKDAHDKSFADCTVKQQTALLKTKEGEAMKLLEGNPGPTSLWFSFKELTLLGFFTSEIVAKNILKYDPIPGEYKGCIPYEAVGGAWAI